jgi:hypothetical protein
MMLFLQSCGDGKIHEGTVEYEVSYPYFNKEGSFLSSMLPQKATFRFKGNKWMMQVKRGRAFSSAFIVDCEAKTMTTLFQFGSKKKYSVMTEAEVLKRRDEKFPKPSYMHTNEGDSIAGFFCRKSIALFEELGQPEATLYYTDAIGIENPNWCFPYHEITGVFMVYELEQWGLRTRFTAEKFDPAPVEDSMFEVPSGYKKVPVADLEKEMEEMFGAIVK